MKKYFLPLGVLGIFMTVAVTLWLTQDNIFYLFNGSIIFLVGLAMPHYRLLIPSASLDMNLRQCFRVITPTATNSGTACFLTPRRAQAS